MSGIEKPGAAVEGRAVVVTLSLLRRAGVKRHPHRQGADLPELGGECHLGGQGSPHGIGSSFEGGVDTVPRRLEEISPALLDDPAQDLVVAGERLTHGCRMLLPQAARTFDVGEQEGDRSARGLAHRPQSIGRRRSSSYAFRLQ
jgi:hypothetical protein